MRRLGGALRLIASVLFAPERARAHYSEVPVEEQEAPHEGPATANTLQFGIECFGAGCNQTSTAKLGGSPRLEADIFRKQRQFLARRALRDRLRVERWSPLSGGAR